MVSAMGKLLMYVAFFAALGGVWWMYSSQVSKVKAIEDEIRLLEDSGTRDAHEQLPQLKTQRDEARGVQTFNGILLSFLSAGVVGIFFVTQFLPMIAHKFTHAIYDSGEMIEEDPMHNARVLFAQGEYEAAIEAFREVTASDPTNRFPWVEISKIQRDNLKDPHAAIATLRDALENHAWEMDDSAFFMFRIAEIYQAELNQPESTVQILQQVGEVFPETRHAANARHKLHELGIS